MSNGDYEDRFQDEQRCSLWLLKKERKGETGRMDIVGYYTTLEGVAKEVFDLGLRDSGATSFSELLQVAKGLRAEIRSAFALWEDE